MRQLAIKSVCFERIERKIRAQKTRYPGSLFEGISFAIGGMTAKSGNKSTNYTCGDWCGYYPFRGRIVCVLRGPATSAGSLLTAGGLLDTDRARYYKVKVLPATLNDVELSSSAELSYITVVDAGSSGCRAHVYRYGKLGNLDGPLYILPEHKSLKVKPGLSTFMENPQDAGKSLQGLIDFLKEVPESDWGTTPFF